MIFLFLATATAFRISGAPGNGGCAPLKEFSMNCQSSIGVEDVQKSLINEYKLTIKDNNGNILSNDVTIIDYKVPFFANMVCSNCIMTLSKGTESSCVFINIKEGGPCSNPVSSNQIPLNTPYPPNTPNPPEVEDKQSIEIKVKITT